MTVNLPDGQSWSDPNAPWNDDDNSELDEFDLDDIDYDARRERAFLLEEDDE